MGLRQGRLGGGGGGGPPPPRPPIDSGQSLGRVRRPSAVFGAILLLESSGMGQGRPAVGWSGPACWSMGLLEAGGLEGPVDRSRGGGPAGNNQRGE